jgi:hypothetical protein
MVMVCQYLVRGDISWYPWYHAVLTTYTTYTRRHVRSAEQMLQSDQTRKSYLIMPQESARVM